MQQLFRSISLHRQQSNVTERHMKKERVRVIEENNLKNGESSKNRFKRHPLHVQNCHNAGRNMVKSFILNILLDVKWTKRWKIAVAAFILHLIQICITSWTEDICWPKCWFIEIETAQLFRSLVFYSIVFCVGVCVCDMQFLFSFHVHRALWTIHWCQFGLTSWNSSRWKSQFRTHYIYDMWFCVFTFLSHYISLIRSQSILFKLGFRFAFDIVAVIELCMINAKVLQIHRCSTLGACSL